MRTISYFPDYGPWNLKKTICLIITLIMQAVLLLALSTGKFSVAINESLQSYIIVNIVMLVNALVSGILCKIAYYRVGSILSTIVNAVLGIYIFVTAISSMEGIIITVLALFFFGFIEYWVVYGGYLLSSLFCKKYSEPGGGITGRKIYSGYSYDVAYRIDGDKIYSGYSYDVAYRIDGDKIYSGYGYDVAFRIDGDKIYSGYGYDVAYRIDGDKIYSGYGYDVAFRIDT